MLISLKTLCIIKNGLSFEMIVMQKCLIRLKINCIVIKEVMDEYYGK